MLLYILIVVVILGAVAASVLLARRRPRAPRPDVPVEEPLREPEGPGEATEIAEEQRLEVVEAPPEPLAVEAVPEPAVVEPAVVEPAVPAAPRPLRERLSRARSSFGQALVGVFRKGGLTDADWDDIEALLLQADVGVGATTRIVADLKAKSRDTDPEKLPDLLRDELLAILGDEDRSLRTRDGLSVWLVTGVNGTGKTTTIGKLALRERSGGRRVVLAAADTFRAAADTQLERWAERSGAEVVKHAPGADPAAVAFDGVKAAKARGADLLVVDTAGRLHTKRNLMEELSKIRRVIEREAGAPDEVLLVLDATTGQNGIAQARAFTEAVEVTGIVLTKLDGTAKGGIVIAVQQELGIPVKLVGVGEGVEDLEPFDPAAFVEALVG